MRRLAYVLLAVMLASLGTGCATTGTNKGRADLITLKQEWDLGAKLAGDLEVRLTLVHDREAEAYLNSVGQQIATQTPFSDLPWHFHLVADPSVNAFIVPGGHIYLSTGLIAEAEDLSEMLGVLAHEVGHGAARHPTVQLKTRYGRAVLVSAAEGHDAAVYRQVLEAFASRGAAASFGREDDRVADELAAKYMHAAGYDPDGMVEVFRELLELRHSEPSSSAQFLSIHPISTEELARIEGKIAKLPKRNDLVMNTSAYRTFRNRIESLAENQK
jgi:predicted Zn-dependent protease